MREAHEAVEDSKAFAFAIMSRVYSLCSRLDVYRLSLDEAKRALLWRARHRVCVPRSAEHSQSRAQK